MSEQRFKVVVTDLLHPDYNNGYNIERSILDPIGAELCLEEIKNEDDFINIAKDADAIIGIFFHITRRALEKLEKLKVICVWGVGTNHLDIPAATEKGVYVANVPDYCMDEVSSHAAALILGCARKISQHDRMLQKEEWGYHTFALRRFAGMTVGIAGMGTIGRSFAKKMSGFNVNLIGFDEYVTEETMKESNVKKVSFDELLSRSDYISIHLPLNDQTYHMFGEAEFKKMKNTACIVNTGRGGIIDEPALLNALNTEEIAGGALDVFENEPLTKKQGLIGHPKMTLTPHMGWKSSDALEECRTKTANAVKDALMGKKPKYTMNM